MADEGDAQLERFWEAAATGVRPVLSLVRARLPSFPASATVVSRVSQLDATLLDVELESLLLEPLRKALGEVKPAWRNAWNDEMALAVKVALWWLGMRQTGRSYGEGLQNMRWSNEMARSRSNPSHHPPPSTLQVSLYPILAILLPYLHGRFSAHFSRFSYSEMPPGDGRRKLWEIVRRAEEFWAAATLLNTLVFLSNGRYRSLVDRILGLRLVYARRAMTRSVSFEFLNRQLVWGAFTEFLLFLLPIINTRRALRRLYRQRSALYSKVSRLSAAVLPASVSSRLGITEDKDKSGAKGKAKEESTSALSEKRGPLWHLPERACAICYRQVNPEAVQDGPAMPSFNFDFPYGDPTEPVFPSTSHSMHTTPPSQATNSSSALLRKAADQADSVAPNDNIDSRWMVQNAYAARPCGHLYCYYCISEKLLSEEAEEYEGPLDEEDERSGRAEPGAGWECLKCSRRVTGARRWVESDGDEGDDEMFSAVTGPAEAASPGEGEALPYKSASQAADAPADVSTLFDDEAE